MEKSSNDAGASFEKITKGARFSASLTRNSKASVAMARWRQLHGFAEGF